VPGGEPKADYVLRMPDGSAAVTRQAATPRATVITPENADEIGQQFDRERRERENALLILHYGEDALTEGGSFRERGTASRVRRRTAPW